MTTAPEPLWTPTAAQIERSTSRATCAGSRPSAASSRRVPRALGLVGRRSRRLLAARCGSSSTSAPSRPYERVLGRRELTGAEWFPGARLSFAEHIFRGKPEDSVAIVHASELRPLAELTWGELRTATRRVAAGLRALGVGPGDRVAGYLPNIVEAVVAFLACASIGATWSSCSPDFGARSVDRPARPDRAEGAARRRRLPLRRARLRPARGRRRIRGRSRASSDVVLPYLDPPAPAGSRGRSPWDRLRRRGRRRLEFAQLPFDHPLWVLYSSGTTGLPKGIVHGQGGILLEYLKAAAPAHRRAAGRADLLVHDHRLDDVELPVGALLTDAAIVLYDGNPARRTWTSLWELAASAGVNLLRDERRLPRTPAARTASSRRAAATSRALRELGSTGSPLSPEGFRWVYATSAPTRGSSR